MLRSITRSLTRHKLTTGLNLAGLALGLAVFLTMALIVRYEYRFDTDLPGTNNLYRADILIDLPGRGHIDSGQGSFVPALFLKSDFTSIAGVLVTRPTGTVVHVGDRIEMEQETLTNADFLDFFHLPLLSGDPKTALATPDRLLLPASLARKYFGTTNVLGRSIVLDQQAKAFTISGVYADPPPNSSLNFGIVAHLPKNAANWMVYSNWGSWWGNVWVHVPDPAAIPALQIALRHYAVRHTGRFTREEIREYLGDGGLHLVPLRAIHFHDSDIAGTGGRALVAILGLIGVAALATAIVNYINLATARAGLRAREVAIHKVMGATRGRLIARYLGEAVATVALAAIAGLALTELGLRFVNALGQWELSLDWSFCLPLLLAVVLLAGIGAGFYPALVLSGYRPGPVLAASRMPSGGRMAAHLRNVLVVLQFGFAITLAICTLVMTQQAHFEQTMARGLRTSGVITLFSATNESLSKQLGPLTRAMRDVPGVTAAEQSDLFLHHSENAEDFSLDGHPDIDPSLSWGNATPGFADLYGLKILAGRWFDASHGLDQGGRHQPDLVPNIVISKLATARLGFTTPQDAVGKVLIEGKKNQFRIIGVIDDMRVFGAHSAMRPLLFFGRSPNEESNTEIAVHIAYAGVAEPVMMERLHAAWTKFAPEVPFSAESTTDMLAEDGSDDAQRGTLFSIGAGIAIGIACFGLYGLSMFTVARRQQEIGIRKALGARTQDVLRLLVGQFLRPVLLGTLIAWPVAWFLMRRWLAGFDQRIALTLLPFAEVTAAALAIGTLTIIAQTARAARLPPAQAIAQG